jgi:DNA invertase Pin-like site-specific DNA recombinase
MVCAGSAEVLVAATLDRLSRSTVDLLGLVDESERCGFGFVTADASVDSSTAPGRMVFTMIAAVSEMKRRLISELTKATLAAKKARGARLGRPVLTP